MKTIVLLSLFIMNFAFASVEGRPFQGEVLFQRIREIYNVRSVGLRRCIYDKKLSDDIVKEMNDKKTLLRSNKFDNFLDKIDLAVEVLRLTDSLPECSWYIKSSDDALRKLQKEKFLRAEKTIESVCVLSTPLASKQCRANVKSIVADLDPFCIVQKNNKDLNGSVDNNPCMAGDGLIARELRVKNDPKQSQMALFLGTLEAHVRAAKEGSHIDLWSIFLKDNKDNASNRKKFLAMMVMANYLGTAGGYVDGLGDHYWRSAFDEGEHAEDIFNEFYSVRNKADWFRFIKTGVKKKSITLSIKHLSLDGMNHHNFMSMFLSCHFRAYGNLVSHVLPPLLGTGYESLDFVSHVKENMGLRNSIKNFAKDTSRYAEGSKFGNAFCSYKI